MSAGEPRAPLRVALGSILPPLRGGGGVGSIGEDTTRCGLNLGRCANASPQLKRVNQRLIRLGSPRPRHLNDRHSIAFADGAGSGGSPIPKIVQWREVDPN